MDKIAVIIPCFNEGITIYKVVRDFKYFLPEASIYVYDNNSTDNTISEAKRAGAIVREEKHQGKGNVIRRILREVNAECYLMVDGDDTYPAVSARELCNKILNENYEMALGDRLGSNYYTVNDRLGHNFGNSLVKKSINLLFNSNVSDVLTGYRAMSYQFAKSLPVLSMGFEIETEITIHSLDKKLLMTTLPICYKNRPAGSFSKLNTFKDGIRVLLTVFNLFKNFRPLLFFSLMSFLLLLISIILLIPVFVEYFNTGFVPRFPTLIMGLFISLVAIQSFFTGLQLDIVVSSERKDFEFKLIQLSHYKLQNFKEKVNGF
jgi:glycosyltransferase involved in cell wall biosynthesis